ncbi:zinc-dependent metalloprotease [Flavilitoribacter nigricans]|uniref:T9SS type A sorting domain-containing protein n=1 Tax=Flavilitoribacter nigricans (strain ATCC 23147 / DSM 23189 / NBRC 102662 / NCIMB 1420 / SS-2) TaxID=1122177 RepID=A0A2D0N387_FLAN2|nr:zinc-dependent metalloprotease [Flavilitoribacter nigricans]PHN02609.1 hypothetical protein CRP01_30920 [Flavilitoribacter nigricans DSM 23189 = NBRC 102662]
MTDSKSTLLLQLVITVLASLCFNSTFAQRSGPVVAPDPETAPASISSCGFTRAYEQKMQQEPFRLRQEAIEKLLYNNARDILENRGAGRSSAAEEILTIPVVVHIVHLASEPNPGDGPSNPTDEQIIAGIEHLNKAYRNIGAYAGNGRQSHAALQSVDVGIEFCLAQRDINGNPSTGILRYANDGFSNMDMEADDPQMQQWVADQSGNAYPGSDYANVWLVNEICSSGSSSCSVAGYAYFPGNHGSVSNGVINRARYWGSSEDNSKVHIHEFGHYLNLYHTFQGSCSNNDCLADGDRVCDTPPDASTSYNACGSDVNSCSTDADSPNSPFQTDVGDLYENYMDYSSNNCQNTFTQGQKERMRSALLGARGSLLNSQACIPVDGAEAGLVSILYPAQSLCSTDFAPVVEVESNGNQPITSLVLGVSLDGFPQPNVNWSGNIQPDQTARITLDQIGFSGSGVHELKIQILSSNGGPDPFTNNNVQVQRFQYAEPLTSLPFCVDLESGQLTPDWVISNPDNGVGFESFPINTCSDGGNFVLGLQTWGAFPSQTTTEDILTQTIDLKNASSAAFQFDVAYATYYSNFNTVLEVAVSTDCGLNYTDVYSKTGRDLSTAQRVASGASDLNAFFIPSDCSEWRSESIALDQFLGQNILIRIRAKTADLTNSTYGFYWGNNLYLDNLCLSGTNSGGNNGGGSDPNGGGNTGTGDCTSEELELINGTITSGNYDNVGMIYAGEAVANNADVTFRASEMVVLLPGFKVDRGTQFQATIGDCQTGAIVEEEPVAESGLLEDRANTADHLGVMNLNIAPNPFSAQTQISYQLPENASSADLMLLDLNGKQLRKFSLPNSQETHQQQLYLNRDDLPAGMYFLMLRYQGRQITKKLMVVGE